ncbi:MAG: hypothetical protein Homavirus39_1, partial [Homavirus sp.]
NVSLECETKDKDRPIHLACKNNNTDIVKYLIDKNVSLECETLCKHRPIHIACRNSNIEIFKYLMDKNVNIECEIFPRMKPIHIVCRNGNIEMFKYLMDKNVNLECGTIDHETPIHIACENNYTDIVKDLIDKNVDLECEDGYKIVSFKKGEATYKWRPIHYISKFGDINTIMYLIDHGVNLDSKAESIHCDISTKYTPIELLQFNEKLSNDEKQQLTQYMTNKILKV